MERRRFMAAAGSSLAGGSLLGASAFNLNSVDPVDHNSSKPFKLKYAPHFGMFKHSAGEDLIDQLRFMKDHGFQAMEDNGMMKRDLDEQKRIAKEMERLEMEMGVFVAYADFGNPAWSGYRLDAGERKREPEAVRAMLRKQMEEAVEVGKRVNAKWATVVPGTFDPSLEPDYQTANVIDNLKMCAEICEKSGLIMVLEPLNHMNHPGLFLTRIPQAFAICKAVNHPCCKILDDLYHQQITEGNLIPNLDRAWDEIAYIQVGDNPGRKEPTTGEINYLNVFKHLHEKGFRGIVGMEHGNKHAGKEGEEALLKAYRSVDAFPVS